MSNEHRTLLAFDYGKKRIGVAVGQELTCTATALETLPAKDGKPDWDAVSRLVDEWHPDAFVLGLPYNMDGSEHELATEIRRFGNRLNGRYNLPVFYMDERLSSLEAERLLKQGSAKKIKQKGLIDQLSAQIILQSWLNQ